MADSIKISETNRYGGKVTIVAKVKLSCKHELFKEIRVADNNASRKAGRASVSRELRNAISEHFLRCNKK